MKFIEAFIIFCYIFCTSFASYYKFTKIETCETSGKSGHLEYCNFTATSVFVVLNNTVTVNSINAEISLFQLQNSNYRQLFKAPKVNWCKLTEQRNKNAVLKIIFESLKTYASDFVRSCPLPPGIYRVTGLKIDRKYISILPEGKYRFTLRAFNNRDEAMLKVSLCLEILS
ncbi:hypothetical protein PVAND_016510 [Polypedilum vanderplanki]|uniref:MD-2-related lipid-recognition domain-containing protein n=1 Tax=Polypedilum vanderplanki TaxID=319348 RepID=A0A9J6BFM7_POLVA|nr:hypothetical protein PVAND_016510 [Polypedilum vanderplanki]